MILSYRDILSAIGRFFSKRKNRRLTYLLIVSLVALGDFLYSGLVRRTFVFYSDIGGNVAVEDRMIRRSRDRETDIRRYVDEALLGPASPDSTPLFPRETRLDSFMYRDTVVYADLSESAAVPLGGEGVFGNLLTLNEGIRRNFPYVKDVRLFIGGNAVFFEEFFGFFTNSADNSKTAP
ncbi:MAG: hypothetical protein LBH42_07355 [Treponema sp.]|jgi:hypothetical protein|nr:hypothetical protein [Treponema sp.]